MGNACDRAWRILQTALLRPSADYEKSIRTRMARRVLEAVEGGERDPDQLKSVALG
jgi:hypothetical protein